MAETYYTKDHEWVRVDGETGTVGITQYAADQLGDVVFVELPEAGKSFEKGGEAATVESVKAASDVYTPVSGEVIEANDALAEEPGGVNEDPTGAGWFFKIKLTNADELKSLMDDAAYKEYVAGLD